MRFKLAATHLVWLLLSIGNAMAQVTYDASSKAFCVVNGSCTSGNTVLTFSHTTSSGTGRGIALGCTVGGGSATVQPNISTATYAGVSMSQLAKRDANYDTYIWTLADGVQPTSGANNFVVTLASALVSGADTLTCVGISWTGGNASTTWTVSNCTGAGNSATASCTLGASGASDMLVVFVCNGTSIGAVGTGLTSRQTTDDSAGACNSFGGATGTGGTTAVSWTVGNDTWQILAAAAKTASASTAPQRLLTQGIGF